LFSSCLFQPREIEEFHITQAPNNCIKILQILSTVATSNSSLGNLFNNTNHNQRKKHIHKFPENKHTQE